MNRKQGTLALAVAIGLTLLTYFGIVGYVFDHDTFYASTVIAGTGLFGFLHGFKYPWHSVKWSEVVVGMGLLGTIVGLSTGMAAVEQSGNGADALWGAFTAFHTTGVGLTSALILRVQYWIADGEL